MQIDHYSNMPCYPNIIIGSAAKTLIMVIGLTDYGRRSKVKM
jgi:hypothetical protein